MECQQQHKRKHYGFGITHKVKCKKEAKFIDENGRDLCTKHFKTWYKKKYKVDYE